MKEKRLKYILRKAEWKTSRRDREYVSNGEMAIW